MPRSRRVVGEYWRDLSLAFDLRVALGGGFWAEAGVDCGGVLVPLVAEADGRRAAGLGGAFMGVALGVARTF